jgi:hypothetical protein
MTIISAGGAVVGAGGAAGGYQIERSLRFDSSASAHLSRTFGAPGDLQTWTWSAWVKGYFVRASGSLSLFEVTSGDGGIATGIRFNGTGNFEYFCQGTGGTGNLITSAVYRDPSAWYHLVVAVDTTQATAANRIKMYVNGVQVTAFGTATYQNQNTNTLVGTTSYAHIIGKIPYASVYYNGYMTEVHFVNAQQLSPTDFGEYNEDTGVWQPKAYTGSYSGNSFYLNFSDNASTTTLGDDLSGNGNDWTTSGFSVTAGVDNDSLVDTPTNYGTDTGVGGEVRGNYCTLNPLFVPGSKPTISDGNLTATANAGTFQAAVGSIIVPKTGKWYWEMTATTVSANLVVLMLARASGTGLYSATNNYTYMSDGTIRYNNVDETSVATFTSGNVLAVSVDDGVVKFYKNNALIKTWSQNLSADADNYVPCCNVHTASNSVSFNFGQRPFAYTAPSGFKALCTQNLPESEATIPNGREYFDVDVYTGIAGTYTKSGLDFQPDLIWGKARNAAAAHRLVDAVRGGTLKLTTSSPDAQNTDVAPYTFTSDGYSIPGGVNHNNNTGTTYAAWLWKANGAGVTNTDGSVTSTVSANTDAGFSIVTYTATAADPITVGHGLGVAPSMFVVKSRSAAGTDWFVYHSSLGATKNLRINTLAGAATATNVWNDTAPTSTVITTSNAINTNTQTYVAYCFAAIPGYSAFGSYTGSTTKVFVYLGFRPAFVLLKKSSEASTTYGWPIVDNSRPFNTTTYEGYNPTLELWADAATGELSSTSNYDIDLLSNGFCINQANNTNVSGSGKTYIYAAFAENPFKYSLAR